jgi:hypothetical protein
MLRAPSEGPARAIETLAVPVTINAAAKRTPGRRRLVTDDEIELLKQPLCRQLAMVMRWSR